jgi:hypothetical protein
MWAGDPVDHLSIADPSQVGPELAKSVVGSYSKPPEQVPTAKMAGGPVLGNGDLGVVLGGTADQLTFYCGKNDFFGVLKGGMTAVGSLNLSIPALKDSTNYTLEQYPGNAQITGTFGEKNQSALALSSWVSTSENLLFLTLKNTGKKPLDISSRLLDGLGTPGNSATCSASISGGTISMRVSPDTINLELGSRSHVPGTRIPTEIPFVGEIAEFRLYQQALIPEQFETQNPAPLLISHLSTDGTSAGGVERKTQAVHGGSAKFTGQSGEDLLLGALLIPQKQFTMEAWVQTGAPKPGIAYLVGACVYPNERNTHGLSLVLVDGKPSVRLNKAIVTAEKPLIQNQWTHLAATYDGSVLRLYQDHQCMGETNNFPTRDQVMGSEIYSVHLGYTNLPYQGCSPQGLMVLRTMDCEPKIENQTLKFPLAPHQEATLALSIVTDRNTTNFEAHAKRLVEDLNPARISSLKQKHDSWWNDFWGKSFVEIPDKIIQDNWYGSLYLLACCSKAGCPPPGLWGNFVTVPEMAWNGDYTLNYNFEAPFWGALATHHGELAESYDTPVLDYMPRGSALAIKQHHPGLYYNTHLIPTPGWNNGGATDNGQKCSALFASVNMVHRWRYTRDLDYAKKVYPFLKGVVDYWDDALVLQNGLYVDPKDDAGEWKESDTPATTLAFLRLLYPTMIELSTLLHRDQDQVSRWKKILGKLSPLPIVPAGSIDHLETSLDFNAHRLPSGQRSVNNPSITLQDILGADLVKDRMVIRNAVSGYGFPFPMVHVYQNRQQRCSGPGMSSCQCIFPGWAIGMESSEAEKKAALDTITLSAQWYDFNNQCSFYPGAACAGYDPKEILTNLHELIARYAYPNFMIHAGGGGVENFAVTPATLAAMFVQSYQKNIHLFPDWPKDQNATFGNFNACGGFLISSQIKQSKVVYVKVESNSGQECRIMNPWNEKPVSIVSNDGSTISQRGKLLTFPTHTGETFVIKPAL